MSKYGIFVLKLVSMHLPVKLVKHVCISTENFEIHTFTQ